MNNEVTEQILDYIRNRYFGKYRGKVVDNLDPVAQGRIQVEVPAVLGDLRPWAMPCFPFAGNDMGQYTVPEVGAGVWVEFEGGDPSYPIWTGGFYATNELPKDETGAPTQPNLKIIKSKQGLMVTMNDLTQTIALSDKDGNNMLTIEVLKGTIKIKGAIKAVVEAPLIELVENSFHPVVFGDELMSYLSQITAMFNAHTHPGELALGAFPVTPAPPLPTMPPPTPSLISTKVKTG